jgi:FHA domain-containing protein
LDLLDLAIFLLRIVLVALLYGFLVLVIRVAARGLQGASSSAAPRQGVADASVLRLIVVEAGGASLTPGQIIEVADGAVLGRAERVEVALADAAVSGEHAQLMRGDRTWLVRDLGSTNGTRVNNAPVKGDMPLATGDVLGLGNVRLKVLPR